MPWNILWVKFGWHNQGRAHIRHLKPLIILLLCLTCAVSTVLPWCSCLSICVCVFGCKQVCSLVSHSVFRYPLSNTLTTIQETRTVQLSNLASLVKKDTDLLKYTGCSLKDTMTRSYTRSWRHSITSICCPHISPDLFPWQQSPSSHPTSSLLCEPNIPFLEFYLDELGGFRGFLAKCLLVFKQPPYPYHSIRLSWHMYWVWASALERAKGIRESQPCHPYLYTSFFCNFEVKKLKVFNKPVHEIDSTHWMLALHQ